MDKQRLNELLAEHVLEWKHYKSLPHEYPDPTGSWEGVGEVVEAMRKHPREKDFYRILLQDEDIYDAEPVDMVQGLFFMLTEQPEYVGKCALKALNVEVE